MNEENPALQEYIEWLATPPEEREIKTQHELAKKLGVNEPQLSKWKSELNLQSAKPSEIVEFKNLVWKFFKEGKGAKYGDLWWGIVNPNKKEIKGEELSADELINIGIKTIEGLRNEYREGSGNCPVCSKPKSFRNEAHLDTEPEQQEDREVATVAVPTRSD